MKKVFPAILLFAIIITGLVFWNNNNDEGPWQPTIDEETGVITLPPGLRGDLFYYPIEDDCQEQMDQYIVESEYNTCELISSVVGETTEECLSEGITTGGCSICKLKCE